MSTSRTIQTQSQSQTAPSKLVEHAQRANAQRQSARVLMERDQREVPSVPTRLRFDPRPDLIEDQALWRGLLLLAAVEPDADDPNCIYGVLHALRCCGARLAWTESRTLRLQGDGYGTRYYGNWRDDRQRWLLPRRVQLTRLLAETPAFVRESSGAWDAGVDVQVCIRSR